MKKVYVVSFALAASILLSMAGAAASSGAVCLNRAVFALLPAKYKTEAICLELDVNHKMLASEPGGTWRLMGRWFVGGVEVTASLNVTTEGLVELIHLAGGFLEPEAVIDCEGAFDGTINAEGEGTITAVLNTAKEEITLTLTLVCTNVKNCPEPLVTAENLPWNTELASEEPGIKEIILSGGTGNPAYEIRCDGLAIETLCEGETEALLTNVASGVEGEFIASEIESDGFEGNCGTSTKVALQKGKGTTKLSAGSEVVSVEED